MCKTGASGNILCQDGSSATRHFPGGDRDSYNPQGKQDHQSRPERPRKRRRWRFPGAPLDVRRTSLGRSGLVRPVIRRGPGRLFRNACDLLCPRGRSASQSSDSKHDAHARQPATHCSLHPISHPFPRRLRKITIYGSERPRLEILKTQDWAATLLNWVIRRMCKSKSRRYHTAHA
jgi:hypothetical protein